jgi:hypothetical protein
MRLAALALFASLAAQAAAQDVRPVARGSVDTASQDAGIRPVSRPDGLGQPVPVLTNPAAVTTSILPDVRPPSVVATGEAARLARLRGQICGDPSIQGNPIGPVLGRGACGIDDAVRVRSVAGVSLKPSATVDCRTATALKTWVERGVIPAVGSEGGGPETLRVVSHYACRTRNNQAGTRLSEHAFGRAIDVAGIGLRDGTEMTLLTDWNSRDNGAQLRQMWRAACGPFGTVLGPEANRFHRDHFHFDTARYRSGTFCR